MTARSEHGVESDAGFLGSAPAGSPLTKAEVAALPEGTPITVIWSGGNGPHDYVIAVNDRGQRHAAAEDASERMRFYNPLTFTGLQRYNNRVWTRDIPPAESGDDRR